MSYRRRKCFAWMFATSAMLVACGTVITLNRVSPVGRHTCDSKNSEVEKQSEVEVTFRNVGAHVDLSGTLTCSVSKTPSPAVLLVSGGGMVDRENSYKPIGMMSVIANRLAQHGIRSLRYDKRGVGKSGGSYSDASLQDFADDAASGIAYLRSLDHVDAGKIGILGHSEGGVVAAIAASACVNVRFVVLLGVPGQSHEMSEHQWILSETATRGYGIEATSRILEQHRILNELIKSGKSDRETLARAKKAATIAMSVPDVDQAVHDMFTRRYRSLLTFDPTKSLASIKCPVLALHGGLDRQIQAHVELPMVRKCLNVNADATIKVLEGLNHTFQRCATGDLEESYTIDSPIDDVAVQEIVSWIRRMYPGNESRN